MNSNDTANTPYDKLSNAIPVALAFLMPIFFLPTTTEFFEFNKMYLLLISTLVLLLAWAAKFLFGKNISIVRSIIDAPFLTFVFVVLLSTIFSIDKFSGIYGSHGRWFPSLAGYLVLAIFYYLVSSGIRGSETIKSTLYALVYGITLSSVVGILAYYKIFLGSATYLRSPGFTLTGSVTTASVIAAIAVVTALGLFSLKMKSSLAKTALSASVLINFTFLCLSNVTAGWVVFVVGFIGSLALVKHQKSLRKDPVIMVVVAVALVIFASTIIPVTKNIMTQPDYPKEVGLPFQTSWKIASSVIRDYPFLATGPSTFYMTFSRYRVLELNNSPYWTVRFDKPHNEVFNILSTMGIVGIIATIFFCVRLFKVFSYSVHLKDEEGTSRILLSLLPALGSVFLFTYAGVLNSFLFFLILALLINMAANGKLSTVASILNIELSISEAVASIGGGTKAKGKKKSTRFAGIPSIVLVLVTGYLGQRVYSAEYFSRKAIEAALANDGRATYDYQAKAIRTNPKKDVYYNSFARTNLALANSLAAKPELTEGDKEAIQTLLAKSIGSARLATEVANPLSVRNWETRAQVYRAIIQVTDNAADWAVTAYNSAIQLEPTNPKLRLDMGGIYYAAGNHLAAANQFRQAFALKPDYANAYFNYAQSLIQLRDYQTALASLEKTKTLIQEGTPDYQLITTQIEQLSALPEVSGVQTQKPTVEEVEAAEEKPEEVVEEAPQEPLTSVGEKTPEDSDNLDEETLVETEESQEEESQETQE